MADYKKMYLKLFRSVTAAISLLQEAQVEAEGLFLEAEEPVMTVIEIDGKRRRD